MTEHEKHIATLRDLKSCAMAWEPDVRLLGNVTAASMNDALCYAITALESAQQWQPINTIPEGVHVLVHHTKWPSQPVRIGLRLNSFGDLVDDANNQIRATHWMPLPEVPK